MKGTIRNLNMTHRFVLSLVLGASILVFGAPTGECPELR